jgi:hypothetical protein
MFVGRGTVGPSARQEALRHEVGTDRAIDVVPQARAVDLGDVGKDFDVALDGVEATRDLTDSVVKGDETIFDLGDALLGIESAVDFGGKLVRILCRLKGAVGPDVRQGVVRQSFVLDTFSQNTCEGVGRPRRFGLGGVAQRLGPGQVRHGVGGIGIEHDLEDHALVGPIGLLHPFLRTARRDCVEIERLAFLEQGLLCVDFVAARFGCLTERHQERVLGDNCHLGGRLFRVLCHRGQARNSKEDGGEDGGFNGGEHARTPVLRVSELSGRIIPNSEEDSSTL